ncbi:hypothetical protein [Actinacidiphila acididurans]|uniref:Uncharacterized protein n=1 Tax=Actinacidiphila acididurans TaxID=2784346 RepID=A0ABS2TXY2_9ACTN|nr:hypothetical protein [Actinacidiphila acididurans]MBM9507826.1 hypothetical protein [Actinacidiphila acididurans]
MESLTLDGWQPAEFLVVAQLDLTVRALEERSLTVEFDEVHGEHTAVLRVSNAGLVFCLVATPPYAGFALLCGDPDGMGWEEALDIFLAQTPFGRSAVTWVPGDVPDDVRVAAGADEEHPAVHTDRPHAKDNPVAEAPQVP